MPRTYVKKGGRGGRRKGAGRPRKKWGETGRLVPVGPFLVIIDDDYGKPPPKRIRGVGLKWQGVSWNDIDWETYSWSKREGKAVVIPKAIDLPIDLNAIGPDGLGRPLFRVFPQQFRSADGKPRDTFSFDDPANSHWLENKVSLRAIGIDGRKRRTSELDDDLG